MYKGVALLSALLAVASAQHGSLAGHGVAAVVAAPAAVSQQSRHDIITPGVAVATIAQPVAVAPVAQAAPVAPVVTAVRVPATALTSRLDVSSPVYGGVAAIGGLGGGLGAGGYGVGGLAVGGLGNAGVLGGLGAGGHGY